MRIAIVGPCAAGKTTLAEALQAHGYNARQIAQEHSFVPEMWRIITQPDVLIYLDGSYEVCTHRKGFNWLPHEHAEQLRRLAHARKHCDVYIHTDELTPAEVLERALAALQVANLKE